MIERLRVSNYKSLRDIEVDFADFTVLVGQNNSGKSAIMEAILLFKLAAEKSIDGAYQITDLEYVGGLFNSWQDAYYRNQGQRAETMTIVPRFNFEKADGYGEMLKLSQDSGFHPELPTSIWIGASLTGESWRPVYQLESEQTGTIVDLCTITEQRGTRGNKSVWGVDVPIEKGEGGLEMGGLLNPIRINRGDTKRWLRSIRSAALDELSRLYYISDSRDITQWEDDPQEHEFVGYTGEQTVSMLHALRDDEVIFERVVTAIRNISDDIDEIRADMHDTNTRTELIDSDTEEFFNAVASGAGLRRLLPIIVQIAAAEEGDTVMIEEPEISVYPKITERLLQFILDAVVERGVQVIVSTNSLPFIWKYEDIVDSSVGHALECKKRDGETIVEQKPIGNTLVFEEYYGGENQSS